MKPVVYIDIDNTLARKVVSKRVPLEHMVKLVRELSERAELYR